MFEIVAIIVCVNILILLKIFLNINFKEIKNIKGTNTEELEALSNKFPEDEKICKDILKKINNNSEVNIKIDEEYSSCLYTVFNNTITIGKFKQKYMKIQTIVHECIHSHQDKMLLWGNFIFSNIYLGYYILIVILDILNKLPYSQIHIMNLILSGLVQYILRNSLENEAMIKARYVAEDYMDENKFLDKNEEKMLLDEYDRVNKIGIPFMNYYLIANNIIKVIIFSVIVLI